VAAAVVPDHKPHRRRTQFRDNLNKGPSFEDFLRKKTTEDDSMLDPLQKAKAGKEDARLPKWLKTEIPKGKNFHKLKSDLRGLKLGRDR
jgi:lipoic acid synthetase